MKILLEYDPETGTATDANGIIIIHPGLKSFEIEAKSEILDLVKQGLSADDLVKLKNLDII